MAVLLEQYDGAAAIFNGQLRFLSGSLYKGIPRRNQRFSLSIVSVCWLKASNTMFINSVPLATSMPFNWLTCCTLNGLPNITAFGVSNKKQNCCTRTTGTTQYANTVKHKTLYRMEYRSWTNVSSQRVVYTVKPDARTGPDSHHTQQAMLCHL